MPEWPTGTVTFVFTDMEGSTRLLQRLGAAYSSVLADHHALLRATFEKWNGCEIDTQGDAFFVVLSRAADAIAVVVEAQRSLLAHAWPEGAPVRVRMGLLTGEPLLGPPATWEWMCIALRASPQPGTAGRCCCHKPRTTWFSTICAFLQGGMHIHTKTVYNEPNGGGSMPRSPSLRPLPAFDSFGPALKYLRRRAHLSQRDLSIAVGYSESQISRFEGSYRPPDLATLRAQFVPALLIEDEPEVVARLLELAAAARAEPVPDWVFPAPTSPPDVANQPIHLPDRLPRRPSGNLPLPLTSYVGREKEMAEVSSLLMQESTRLVTLTGAGGSGKTRLAVQVAAGLVEHFQDGVYFVPLAAIHDPGLAILTVAHTAGVRETPGYSIMEELTIALRDKHLLLILDNFEQVTDAAPLVAEFVSACPHLRVLVTSREILRLRGERVYPVPPLSLPDPKRLPALEAMLRYPAVELFVQRARAAKPDFSLSQDNLPAVVDICARVDGLPLAIELAAARVKLLPPPAIVKRLERSLSFLTGGARDLPARHQALRNTIDWSYELLDHRERHHFDRLSVFVGGCSLEAAEAICSGERPTGDEVLDTLEALVDQSLLQPVETGDEPRFAMLETLREYGVERLAASGASQVMRQRHAHYYLALAEQADAKLETREQALWLDRLQRDLDNLRAALDWFADSGQADEGLRLASALWRFWEVHGYLAEGRGRLAQLLDLPQASVSRAVRIKALYVAGVLADAQCDYATARTLFEENLALARAEGDAGSVGTALSNLGNVVNAQGDHAAAQRYYKEALGIFRALDDATGIAWSLKNLANLAQKQGDYEAARSLSEEALVLFEQWGVAGQVAMMLNDLAGVHSAQGDLAAARRAYERSLAIFRELGNDGAVAIATTNLGKVACAQGDFETARALYRQALALAQSLGDMRGTARLFESYAALSAAEAQPERALRLYGAAAALRMVYGAPLSATEQRKVEQTLAFARQSLDRAQVSALWATGQAWALDEAIAYALSRNT